MFTGLRSRDYCLLDTFNATCGIDEVVVMETAWFGRLYIGRCVPREYDMGCKANVLPNVDAQCSGLQQCKMEVTELSRQGVRPCPEGAMPFLEAAYRCIKGLLKILCYHCISTVSIFLEYHAIHTRCLKYV